MKVKTKITIIFFLLISLSLIVSCEAELNKTSTIDSEELVPEPSEVMPAEDEIPINTDLENTDLNSEAECTVDSDCVPASCCHANTCIPVSKAPSCGDVFCTQECQAGTIDCGGGCFCDEGSCNAKLTDLTNT